MALAGFIIGFLLASRRVRNAIWLLAGLVWFRLDPLDALTWLGIVLAGMLAWELACARAATGEARSVQLDSQADVLE